MAKFKKIIVAGPLVVETVYPAPNPRDSLGVRQGKKRLSSEAQQRMNLKYAYQKLELEIAANFGVKDLYATFTYDDAHLPDSRKEANARMQAFWKRLRAARKAQGQELRYIYVTEHKHGDGRWHHHVLLNATGDDYDLIRKLWGQGGSSFRSGSTGIRTSRPLPGTCARNSGTRSGSGSGQDPAISANLSASASASPTIPHSHLPRMPWC